MRGALHGGELELKRPLSYGILLWILGFVWGSAVFVVPMLRNLPSLPYFSKYPAISFPLLIAYGLLMAYFSGGSVANGRSAAAFRFGLIVAALNLTLDVIVYFLLLQSLDYFQYLSVWISYAELLLIPWISVQLRGR